MAKIRVPILGTTGKAVTLDPRATEGATIGKDLKLPDGRVPTLEELRQLLGGSQQSDTPTPGLSNTLWRLIGEIPANVQRVAALGSAGLVVRQADGGWLTRQLAVADAARLTLADADGQDGNPTLDLAEVDYVTAGALLAILLDAYGRVIGWRPAVLDDLEDVVITAPEQHHVLSYDESSADWINVRSGPQYLVQTEDERFWLADEFVRGINLIGVRSAGAPLVYLPHDLPPEHIVTVKDEAGSGQVTVRIY